MSDFEKEFDALMQERRAWMQENYKRTLPSGELIYNRFQKARDLGFGEGSSIYDTSVVMGEVRVGEHVWIGPYTLLDGSSGELEIGDFVSIDSGVQIYTHDSTRHYVSGGKMPFENGPVSIGSNTVIGSMSMIRVALCCSGPLLRQPRPSRLVHRRRLPREGDRQSEGA